MFTKSLTDHTTIRFYRLNRILNSKQPECFIKFCWKKCNFSFSQFPVTPKKFYKQYKHLCKTFSWYHKEDWKWKFTLVFFVGSGIGHSGLNICMELSRNIFKEKVLKYFFSKTLKYWIGVQRGQSYLMGRRCLFSLGWPPF